MLMREMMMMEGYDEDGQGEGEDGQGEGEDDVVIMSFGGSDCR